jgi:hypothetical protein
MVAACHPALKTMTFCPRTQQCQKKLMTSGQMRRHAKFHGYKLAHVPSHPNTSCIGQSAVFVVSTYCTLYLQIDILNPTRTLIRWLQDGMDVDHSNANVLLVSLKEDVHVQAARADYMLCKGKTLDAYKLCCKVLRQEPRATECLNVYLACLVELGKKNELFQLAHRYACYCDVAKRGSG